MPAFESLYFGTKVEVDGRYGKVCSIIGKKAMIEWDDGEYGDLPSEGWSLVPTEPVPAPMVAAAHADENKAVGDAPVPMVAAAHTDENQADGDAPVPMVVAVHADETKAEGDARASGGRGAKRQREEHVEAQPDAPRAEPGDILYESPGGAIVVCEPELSENDGLDLDIHRYVDPSKNKNFRRMVWAVILLPLGELEEVWPSFSSDLSAAAKGFHMVMANTGKEIAVLLHKAADKVVNVKNAKPFKLIAKDPLPLVRALFRCKQVVFDMQLQDKGGQKVTAMEVIQSYVRLNELEFMAHLIDLKEDKRLGKDSLTAEEQFLLAHADDMAKLKKKVAERERLKTMLQESDSTLRFPWDFDINDDTVVVWRLDPETLQREVASDPVAAIMAAMGEQTVAFVGPPKHCKTPCAKSLASLYSATNGHDKFVLTQTADSMRRLCDFGLILAGMGILLDEWVPRTTACGAQGGGIDHVKNMVDPEDAKTIEARFTDFTVPVDCARVITCQNVGKILPLLDGGWFEKAGPEDILAMVGDNQDYKAVFKRILFVEVKKPLIKAELRKTFANERKQSRADALMAHANQSRESEPPLVANPVIFNPVPKAIANGNRAALTRF
eukprot:gnl/TRDRNA2_/TRDRNA2_40393_c0_seq1.p1 gnl/TRDRNA2_/TRDRNA2_40393_c0~~gnl/TRDRNA2_/TRDRNA2_40393_c0_seq1.p1  ORF type:complete len:661 (-),score=164.19 gnl/TRDRNA2_/TRDRNA2_40393_c0_seq1:217-2052(-)